MKILLRPNKNAIKEVDKYTKIACLISMVNMEIGIITEESVSSVNLFVGKIKVKYSIITDRAVNKPPFAKYTLFFT